MIEILYPNHEERVEKFVKTSDILETRLREKSLVALQGLSRDPDNVCQAAQLVKF